MFEYADCAACFRDDAEDDSVVAEEGTVVVASISFASLEYPNRPKPFPASSDNKVATIAALRSSKHPVGETNYDSRNNAIII